MSRLAHTELALHALALSPQWGDVVSNAHGAVAPRIDDLRKAVAAAMSRIAAALRMMRQNEPIPDLRPIYAVLKSEPASSPELTTLADHLVDAINTLDEICRNRLEAHMAGSVPALVARENPNG